MVFVSQPKRRQPPSVFQIGIQRKAVFFLWQRSAVRKHLDGAGKVVSDHVFEFLAPAWSVWWKPLACGEANRGHIKTRVHAATAVKTDFCRVEFIEVVEDTADGKP